MMDFPDEHLAVAPVRGPLRLEDALFVAKKSTRLAPLQVVRADRVVGEDHLRSAALHAHRAFREGRNKADRLEVEFTRYLAGKRTIREAIAHMGLPDEADAAIVVALGDGRADAIEHFLETLGLEEDDALLRADDERLRAFGITDDQIAATTHEHRFELALEAVAAVDVMRA